MKMTPNHFLKQLLLYSTIVLFSLTVRPNSFISSLPSGNTGTVISGYPLPFLEDWSSGDFGTHGWTTESGNWEVNTTEGNPSPAAVFNDLPELIDYDTSLYSYYFNADSIEVMDLWVGFDLKLEADTIISWERMVVEVWSSTTQRWNFAANFSNSHGGFDYINEQVKITYEAIASTFKIRFRAFGQNSSNIGRWCIDNIHVYRECQAPQELEVEVQPDFSRHLDWLMYTPVEQPWMHLDNGINFNSYGTGDMAEFDVASRYPVEMLVSWGLYGCNISQIAFVPAEENATYSLKIWQGDNASELVTDQPVVSPIIGQWNTITLNEPVPIDVSKELWIGYHISTLTGFPAGYDEGPAIDSMGNMINFNGWQTLLNLDPDLNYNWNIQANIGALSLDIKRFNIYRQDNFLGNYEYYASTEGPYLGYTDHNILPGNQYCYKVNTLWIHGNDTCLSPFSNEACDAVSIIENKITSKSNGLSVFPSPASDFIKITSKEPVYYIEMYNSTGEKLFETSYFNIEYIIPATDLPSGLYILRIQMKNRFEILKVIVLH